MSDSSGTAGRTAVITLLSADGGSGLASVVANLAWTLAGAGKRVLVVDWGTEQPHVSAYLAPFHVSNRKGAGYLDGIAGGDANADVLSIVEQFALPMAAGHVDVAVQRDSVSGDQVQPEPAADAAALRARFISLGYDYVLIGAPTGLPAWVAGVTDAAALCFQAKAGNEAVTLARALLRALPLTIRLVPVPTMFGAVLDTRAERHLAAIRTAFGPVAGQRGADSVVWIPYQPYEAYDPVLTVLFEDEDDSAGVRRQYARLADLLTDGAVNVLPPVRQEVRSRYRRGFNADSGADQTVILVAYAGPDRPWADWICSVLSGGGAQARLVRAGEDTPDMTSDVQLVVVSSPVLDSSDRTVLVKLTEQAASTSSAVRVMVGRPATAPAAIEPALELVNITAATARARLLTYFGLIETAAGPENAQWQRFPDTEPDVVSRPPRDPLFVGREFDVEYLRDRLLSAGTGRAVVGISGPPGIGKSSLALAYAYRFAGDYDLIWWISAHDRQSTLSDIAHLGAAMWDRELVGGPSPEYGSTAPLHDLASSTRFVRWLLIYDNADDLDALGGLLPQSDTGHVLITTNNPDDSAIRLTPLSLPECTRLLTNRVIGLSDADARELADAVAGLPLALRLAAEWLIETVRNERSTGASLADATAWAARAFLDRITDTDDPAEEPVSRVIQVVVDSMRQDRHGRLAVLVARLCAFLSAQGVALDLVRSSPMLNHLIATSHLDATQLAVDSTEIDHVLWAGARFGLFHVDWGAQSDLHLHRVVQHWLKTEMTPQESAACQRDVLTVLASYAPIEIHENLAGRASRFAELQKHVTPSGALHSDDDQVRRWLVNQLRFFYTDGDVGVAAAAVEPAYRLLESWTAAFGQEDLLRGRLATQLANIERRLGRPEAALRLDDGALGQQRRTLHRLHPQTLITARGRAGDLRGLGRFDEALQEDQATWQGFRSTLGDDHPHTRAAANNLASSMSLAGDPHSALELELDNYDRRMRLFGASDPNTWWSLTRVGVYHRELGEYDQALTALRTARDRLRQLKRESDVALLVVIWHYGITERLSGAYHSARERTTRALSGLRHALGDSHPDTLACTLSLSMDYRVVGDIDLAIELSRQVIAKYGTEVGLADDHPFVSLAKVCHGLNLYASRQINEALAVVSAGSAGLGDVLGDAHPWTLAAAVAQARVSAGSGNLLSARDLMAQTYGSYREYLGETHTSTLIAAHNLAAVDSAGARFDDGWRDIDVDIPQT